MSNLDQLLAETSARHDHLCPRQVLGVRMGLYAASLLKLDLPQNDKRLFTFVETDGCFADGLAVATGCSLGHRTMRLMDFGKVAATFVDTKTDTAIRIYPHPLARVNAAECRPNARSRWHAQLEAYQELSFDDMFLWQAVTLTLDLKQLISRPGVRVNCAVCGEEIINEREVMIDGQALCLSCAGHGYYHTHETSLNAMTSEIIERHDS